MVGMKPLLNIISWNLSSDGDGSFNMFILKSPRIYTFLPFSFERIHSYVSLNSSSDAFGGRYITPTTVGSYKLVMDTNSGSMCVPRFHVLTMSLKKYFLWKENKSHGTRMIDLTQQHWGGGVSRPSMSAYVLSFLDSMRQRTCFLGHWRT